MDDKEQIENIYYKYWEGMISKDADLLGSMMSDDYYLLHMTGVRQSREEFLDALLDGTLNYYSASHDSVDVEVNGAKATMIGRSRVNAAVYGGGRHTWKLQGDFTLRKIDGVWKLTSSKASTY